MTLKDKEELYEIEREKTACLVNDLLCQFSNIGVIEKKKLEKFSEVVRGANVRINHSGRV